MQIPGSAWNKDSKLLSNIGRGKQNGRRQKYKLRIIWVYTIFCKHSKNKNRCIGFKNNGFHSWTKIFHFKSKLFHSIWNETLLFHVVKGICFLRRCLLQIGFLEWSALIYSKLFWELLYIHRSISMSLSF